MFDFFIFYKSYKGIYQVLRQQPRRAVTNSCEGYFRKVSQGRQYLKTEEDAK